MQAQERGKVSIVPSCLSSLFWKAQGQSHVYYGDALSSLEITLWCLQCWLGKVFFAITKEIGWGLANFVLLNRTGAHAPPHSCPQPPLVSAEVEHLQEGRMNRGVEAVFRRGLDFLERRSEWMPHVGILADEDCGKEGGLKRAWELREEDFLDGAPSLQRLGSRRPPSLPTWKE